MSSSSPSLEHFSARDADSPQTRFLICFPSTGLPLSTYFSAIKMRWMIDTHAEVATANDEDRLCFGTVDSWLLYVRPDYLLLFAERKLND